jgi:hypothetical protein
MSEEEENAELLANIQSVQFKQPEPKQIISGHSFSLLAEENPKIELTNIMEQKATTIFNSYDESHGATGHVSRQDVVQLLIQCDYKYDEAVMHRTVEKMCSSDTLDLHGWLSFLEKYQAPAYYYGQRLRKYCGRGEVEEALSLIVRGCDVNSGDGEGLNSLHYAAELNRIEVIEALHNISGSKLIINCQDKYGWTPLHCAAHHGNIDSVNVLLRLGADVTKCDKTGKTPLHFAAAQGRNNICEALIAAGALLSTPDTHGMTALHDAAYKGNEKTFRLLLASKDGSSCSVIKDVFGNVAENYFTIIVSN